MKNFMESTTPNANLVPLEQLRRLRRQLDHAINTIEFGMPMVEEFQVGRVYPPQPGRFLFAVGDFIITNRNENHQGNPPETMAL